MKPVPAQWPKEVPCKIAFVGEAPGEVETEKGEPFVGPAGKVFNSMLRAANLNREDYLITNLFNVQAPDNNVVPWIQAKGEFLAENLKRLEEEIAAVNPNVIVPLGGSALWAFTGDMGIAKVRGSVDVSKYVAKGRKIVPTYHPAAVMRAWHYLPIAVGDLIKAEREALEGPELNLPTRRFLIEPTLEEFRQFIDKLIMPSPLLSVDIETGWGMLTCIGFAPNEEDAICVPFMDRRNPDRSYWRTIEEELQAWAMVKEVMESPIPKIGQMFGGYDAHWLLTRYGIRTYGLVHDTRLMHHALYPELPKDLGSMAGSYSKQGQWKNWGSFRKTDTKQDG